MPKKKLRVTKSKAVPKKPIEIGTTLMLFGIEHTTVPCPQCSVLNGPQWEEIRLETILPVAAGARAPMSRTSKHKICFDCASAEGLMAQMNRESSSASRTSKKAEKPTKVIQPRFDGEGVIHIEEDGASPSLTACDARRAVRKPEGLTFEMARIAVGNDRQEQLRLPGYPIGLVLTGIMRPSAEGDMDTLHAWQLLKFGTEEQRALVRKDMQMEREVIDSERP